MKELIEKNIILVLEEMNITDVDFDVSHPIHLSLGDYSTNVALIVSQNTNKKSIDIAKEIKEKLLLKNIDGISIIETVSPGFINFFLSAHYFQQNIKKILTEKEKFGENTLNTGKKIIIEHTQPNPFKDFHIGHLVNNTLGESLTRLLKNSGAKVASVTYHGDVGLHVAKTIWALLNRGIETPHLKDLGEAYAYGDKLYIEDLLVKKEIEEINKKIYDGTDEKINLLHSRGKDVSFEHFEELYRLLGSVFDKHFLESDSSKVGLKIVNENLGNIFENSEGAVIFRGENFDKKLHTRVFINSMGLPTYEAKDLGLVSLKNNFFSFDKSITLTDKEQSEYFKVVRTAAEIIFPDLKGKISHISHGRLRLTTGRLSSRLGTIISADQLIGDMKDVILKKMDGKEVTHNEDDLTGIVVGAIKYSILKQSLGNNIIFDYQKALSTDGDSGPYLQYARARAKSIIDKSSPDNTTEIFLSPDNNWETSDIERVLLRFPDTVASATINFSPHTLVTYLINLASLFNSFYSLEKIIDKSDKNSPYKINITEAFMTVMGNGLSLLGMATPDKM